jgi:hypothetical protein
MKVIRALAVAAVTGVVLTMGAAPAQAAPKPVKYKNCTALQKHYKGGVAQAKGVQNKGGKTRYTPTVTKKVYDLNKHLDRDKDRIACER